MLFSSDAVLRDLKVGETSQTAAVTRDIGSSLKEAASPPLPPIVAPLPDGAGPVLSWTVENETQLYGYLVYRSESPDGAMIRVNDEVIEKLSTADGVPVKYRWRDRTAEPGRTYWYKIGTVSLQGERSDLTGKVEKSYRPTAAN
jgi:hypothetical protein